MDFNWTWNLIARRTHYKSQQEERINKVNENVRKKRGKKRHTYRLNKILILEKMSGVILASVPKKNKDWTQIISEWTKLDDSHKWT